MKTNFKKILSLFMTIMFFTISINLTAYAQNQLLAPTNLKATQTTSSITLDWSKVNNATGYRIYYKLPGDLSWRKCVSSTKSNSFTFSNLPSGHIYSFAIRSYKKTSSKTLWSSQKEILTATKTVAPKTIKSTQTSTSISLKWSTVKNATHYRVYQKIDGEWKSLCLTSKTSKTIDNLLSSTKHTFAVRPYIKTENLNIAGEKKTISSTTKPITPKQISATSTKTTATIKWSSVRGATGYRIYQKVGSKWRILDNTTSLSKTIKHLSPGKSYIFAIRAYKKSTTDTLFSARKQIKITCKPNTVGIKTLISSIYFTSDNNLCADICQNGWNSAIEENSTKIPIYINGVKAKTAATLKVSSSNEFQRISVDLSKYDISLNDFPQISFTVPEGFLKTKNGTQYNYAFDVST